MADVENTPPATSAIKDTYTTGGFSDKFLLRSRQIVRWVNHVRQDLAEPHWLPDSVDDALFRTAQDIAALPAGKEGEEQWNPKWRHDDQGDFARQLNTWWRKTLREKELLPLAGKTVLGEPPHKTVPSAQEQLEQHQKMDVAVPLSKFPIQTPPFCSDMPPQQQDKDAITSSTRLAQLLASLHTTTISQSQHHRRSASSTGDNIFRRPNQSQVPRPQSDSGRRPLQPEQGEVDKLGVTWHGNKDRVEEMQPGERLFTRVFRARTLNPEWLPGMGFPESIHKGV